MYKYIYNYVTYSYEFDFTFHELRFAVTKYWGTS